MTDCEECGEKSMGFTCSYCGKTFCSKHRLPENHDCEGLEKAIEEEKQESEKWFQDKEVKNSPPAKRRKPSMFRDALNRFTSNATLMIIVFTSLMFILQPFMPGISPPATGAEGEAINQNPLELNPLTLFPEASYLVERPWTLFTVMFMHGNLFHLFANMVTLYFFGSALERLIGSKKFVTFYFLSGLAASIGMILFQNFLNLYQTGAFIPAVGASGAVIAVFGAVAMLYPRANVLLFFFIPMKIKTLLYGFGVFETFNIALQLIGARFWPFASSAHLTGLIVGVWFGKKLQDRYGRDNSYFNPLEI